MLSLNDAQVDDAHGYFDRAFKARSDSARALLGKGRSGHSVRGHFGGSAAF
jgi:hypothetical protein